jgi:hypothetical protein
MPESVLLSQSSIRANSAMRPGCRVGLKEVRPKGRCQNHCPWPRQGSPPEVTREGGLILPQRVHQWHKRAFAGSSNIDSPPCEWKSICALANAALFPGQCSRLEAAPFRAASPRQSPLFHISLAPRPMQSNCAEVGACLYGLGQVAHRPCDTWIVATASCSLSPLSSPAQCWDTDHVSRDPFPGVLTTSL